MIPPKMTAVTLGSDSLKEYENLKRGWPKKPKEITANNNADSSFAVARQQQAHKRSVQDRIGLKSE